MFLEKLVEKNLPLVKLAIKWQQDGTILPDTYLLDVDTIVNNGKMMIAEANKYGIKLYFMLKQIGRNPYIAQQLMRIGFAGAVCVDFREALTMIKNNIPIGNVGHLVQTPKMVLEQIIAAKPQIITIYSLEKAKEINEICLKMGVKQDIMLRVLGKEDMLYSGQYGGFALQNLAEVVNELETLPAVRIAGVCSFPCFLYNEEKQQTSATPNLKTVQTAAKYLRQRGYNDLQVNMPSATCTATIDQIAKAGGTHGEPGHGLTGSTPYHANDSSAAETIAFCYVSEVSHNLEDKAYCYGGGHYRRGHMKQALVGKNFEHAKCVTATPPSDESIDYHFTLNENCKVSDAVIFCFRTQVFVTRSEVAVVTGLGTRNPTLEGVYSSIGEKLR